MEDYLLISGLLTGIVCAAAGFFMLDRVDRGATGGLLGFFLGPIGLVIAWVIRDNALRDEGSEKERRRRQERDDRAIEQLRKPTRPAAMAQTSTSVIDELERLAALKEKGHVTEEEFNARKRVLLAPSSPSQPQSRRFR